MDANMKVVGGALSGSECSPDELPWQPRSADKYVFEAVSTSWIACLTVSPSVLRCKGLPAGCAGGWATAERLQRLLQVRAHRRLCV